MRRNEFLLLTGAALGSLIGPPLIHGWRDNQISRLPALNGLLSVLDWLDERTPEVFQRYRVTLLATCSLAHARLGQVERSAELLRSAAERNERVCSVEKANPHPPRTDPPGAGSAGLRRRKRAGRLGLGSASRRWPFRIRF